MTRTVHAAALLLLAPSLASASTLCVNTAGSGGCFATIQAAVNAASNGALIDVAAGTYAEHVVVGPKMKLSIVGAGPGATVVDGGGTGAALSAVGANTALSLSGLTAQNGTPGIAVDAQARLLASNCSVTGSTPGITGGSKSNVLLSGCDVSGNFATSPTSGGGIRVTGIGNLSASDSKISDNSGFGIETYALVLERSTVSGNGGGGISLWKGKIDGSTISGNTGEGGISSAVARPLLIKITNSTISGNSAGTGGGINGTHPLLLEHVTITANSASIAGGGLHFVDKVTLKGTIIAGNTAPTGPDCFGADGAAARSSGTNLVEDTTSCTITPLGKSTLISADPLLGPLQNNGGTTDTHALLAGSPAIGVVTAPALCRKPDQRGVARSVPCDVGAYEAP
jgi:hypothetical protein